MFKEEWGTLKGAKATIRFKQDATPHFFRPECVPVAMRAKVDEEIDILLKENIIALNEASWNGKTVWGLQVYCRISRKWSVTISLHPVWITEKSFQQKLV